jgi:CO dehydrogenase maturation factor
MKKNTRVISFSGKGGSGKTTMASLFLSVLLKMQNNDRLLIIDADPDANLSRTIGVEVDKTVGQQMDKRIYELDEREQGPKLRFSIWDTICQGNGFDLLVMGRSRGEGCYCAINSALTSILHDTIKMYDIVIIDHDAGLEHFSRKSGSPTDTLIVTCDPSHLSFDTAKRIKSMIEELGLPYTHQYLVGCRYSEDQKALFTSFAEETGFEVLGLIPNNQEIADLNLIGKNLLSLKDENSALNIVKEMVKKVLSL